MPNIIRHRNLIINLDCLVCVTIDSGKVVIILNGSEKIEIHRQPDDIQDDLDRIWDLIEEKSKVHQNPGLLERLKGVLE